MDLWLIEHQTNNYKLNWRVKGIVCHKRTKVQDLLVLELEEFGRALVLDGAIQVTVMDEYIYNEMITHVPLCIHKNPRKVLIIGGGDGGALREVLKHGTVQKVHLVEIDEEVIEVSKKYLPSMGDSFNDPRVDVVIENGKNYVANTHEKYDVVIVDSSDPVGPAVTLFQKQFYKNCYRILNEDGVLSAQTGSPFFYKKTLNRSFNFIKSLFNHTHLYLACIPTYPSGLWSFTIGSKKYDKSSGNPEKANNTKYFNAEVYRSCWGLPEFVKKILEGDVEF